MKHKYQTKFPLARIKKIMQSDEDVGKVAAAAPVLISKALEIFMQSLINHGCVETRARGAKKLTNAHIKRVIEKEAQFDFLRDLVKDIPDVESEGGRKAGGRKQSAKAEASAEDGDAAPAKAPTRRRKKAAEKAEEDGDDHE